MATASQLKALLKSCGEDDEDRFYTVALQVAAHEARQGHGKLAQDLRKLVDSARDKRSTVVLPARRVEADWTLRLPRGWCPVGERHDATENEVGSFRQDVTSVDGELRVARRWCCAVVGSRWRRLRACSTWPRPSTGRIGGVCACAALDPKEGRWSRFPRVIALKSCEPKERPWKRPSPR